MGYSDKTSPAHYLDASKWNGSAWDSPDSIRWEPQRVSTPASIRLTFTIPEGSAGLDAVTLTSTITNGAATRVVSAEHGFTRGVQALAELDLDLNSGEYLGSFSINSNENGVLVSLVEWEDSVVTFFWTNFVGQTERPA